MIRETIHYSGTVQGVGFRHRTAKIAFGFAIAGYVKNLADGRVKLVAEGEPEEVMEFVDRVQADLGDHIAEVESSRSVATREYGNPGTAQAFRIML